MSDKLTQEDVEAGACTQKEYDECQSVETEGARFEMLKEDFQDELGS
jgi:hypothetical protein